MGTVWGQSGVDGAARAWRATNQSVRVRWSSEMGPLKRALFVLLGVLIMIVLTVVGVAALVLVVVGAVVTALVLGLRRAWWGLIGRPAGGPDREQNELRRNVRVREAGGDSA